VSGVAVVEVPAVVRGCNDCRGARCGAVACATGPTATGTFVAACITITPAETETDIWPILRTGCAPASCCRRVGVTLCSSQPTYVAFSAGEAGEMSAWRIGTETTVSTLGGNSKFASIIDRLVTWIPGDTLALYVPGVALIAARPNASPSSLFLIVMLVVNPLIITGGTFAAGHSFNKQFWVKLVLGTIAFAIWTLTVPSSGWQSWKLIADNPTGVTIVAGIIGLLFGFFADGMMKRV
jgi:hypothetical protein